MRLLFITALVAALVTAAAFPSFAVMEEEEYLMNAVQKLTAPALEGRAAGSVGGKLASYYIAGELQAMEMYPIGKDAPGLMKADYFQYVDMGIVSGAASASPLIGRNVIAWMPGTRRSDLSRGYFLVSAHYDHIGAIYADGVKVGYHPGANDNASGVAVALALARRCSLLGQRLPYPVVFAFFDGEEIGMLGAKAFAESGLMPLDKAFNVNMDMVGLLGDNTLLAAVSAAPEGGKEDETWAQLSEMAGESDITLKPMMQGWQASDHYIFYTMGRPFIFLFGGSTANYDKATDTAEKLDYFAMMRLTHFLWNALATMGAPEKFSRVEMGPPPGMAMGGTRAFIGTIPDFSADVEGVQLSGTVPGSPAEKAGLEVGDIIILVNGMGVDDLESYTAILRTIKPGDRVDMHVMRDGIEIKVSMTAAERGEG